MRRASRKDANHGAVIAAFERMGCSVIDVSGTPCGFDILVGYGGLCIPVEIKDGTKPPSARKLTENEAKVHARWTGGKRIVLDMDGVAATANMLRRWHKALYESIYREELSGPEKRGG